MKRLLVLTLLVFWNSAPSEAQSPHEQYVIIVSIDGFPAEALWDLRAPVPTIRALAREGAWAEAMVPSTPSVTWPNHQTLVTGVHPARHGILTNGTFIRGSDGEPVYRENDVDRDDLSAYPTVYDLAFEAGMTTAEVNWPNTRNARTLHDSFPDAVESVAHTTPRLRSELIEVGILSDESEEAFRSLGAVARDHVWTSAAMHLIRTRKPNLLLVHLLNVDGTHHGHGAWSNPGFTALAHADTHVRDIISALDDAGIRDQTTIFIVSDHGFMNVTKNVRPNVLLRQNGFLEVNDFGEMEEASVHVLSNGGSAMMYATDPETREEDLEKARELLSGAAGIARILEPVEYEAYGLPHPSDNSQMGDLVLGADDGYAFNNSAAGDDHIISLDGTRGAHGHLNDVPQMRALFVASGRGIRSGVELATVDNRSVAPTVARLLGLELETADGAVLEAILNK